MYDLKIMNKRYLFSLLLFLLCCSFTQQHNKEWKRIDNQLYSITFPSYWVARHHTEDGNIPLERDIKTLGYHYYYLMWGTPQGSREDIEKSMYCVIQSYEKLNPDSVITLQKIEELEMRQFSDISKLCSKRIIKSSKNQKRFVIVKESPNLDKTTDILREYFLLQQKGKTAHCLFVTLREKYAQRHPEKTSEIEKIIDSFTVK